MKTTIVFSLLFGAALGMTTKPISKNDTRPYNGTAIRNPDGSVKVPLPHDRLPDHVPEDQRGHGSVSFTAKAFPTATITRIIPGQCLWCQQDCEHSHKGPDVLHCKQNRCAEFCGHPRPTIVEGSRSHTSTN